MTPREDAAVTLLLLAGIACLLAAAFAGIARGNETIRQGRRLFGCRVPGCVMCGGSWRDSETQT